MYTHRKIQLVSVCSCEVNIRDGRYVPTVKYSMAQCDHMTQTYVMVDYVYTGKYSVS